MEHNFLDRYSNLDSVIHRVDPRVKIIAFISFIFFVIFTQPTEFSKFFLYFLLISSVILASRVSLKFIFKRSLVVIPFVLLVGISIPFVKGGEIAGSYSFGSLNLNVSYIGLEIFFNVLIKSWLSVLSMICLVSTTNFPKLLEGFQRLKLPMVMIMLISFMYRHIFVLVDEIMRMIRARDSRSFGGNRMWHIRTIGNIIGTLFIRSYERGERIYVAMLSRGFNGKINILDDFKINNIDISFLTLFFVFLICIRWL